MKSNKDTNIVWLDLEMSGLEPVTDQIMEIATIITNANLEIIDVGPEIVIHQPAKVLDNMDEWCKEHHGESGLTQKSLKSRTTLESAEKRTLEFIEKHCRYHRAFLAGNSVWKDLQFIQYHMPMLEDYLHFCLIDVSSIREVCFRWYPDFFPFEKTYAHRALDDIRLSIEELRYYRQKYFKTP